MFRTDTEWTSRSSGQMKDKGPTKELENVQVRGVINIGSEQ